MDRVMDMVMDNLFFVGWFLLVIIFAVSYISWLHYSNCWSKKRKTTNPEDAKEKKEQVKEREKSRV